MLQKTMMLLRSLTICFIFAFAISCSEEDPIMPTLINIVEELPGVNCPNGGTKIETGTDKNNDKELTANEVLQTKYICNAAPTPTDKQIRLEIGPPNFSTSSTDYQMYQYETQSLIKFNKLNYSNVESIVFVPSIWAGREPLFYPEETTTAFVQLYNVTDNVPINNSEVQSTVNNWIFKESGNIYNDLPSKEVTLVMRVRSSNPILPASTGLKSYIFINKK